MASGVPFTSNGVNVGFTDFSEFTVASGLPSGITAFGVGTGSPRFFAIASDADEGNYFKMTGQNLDSWAFGLDSFFGKAEFGEMLARVYFNVPQTNRASMGPVFSLTGLVGSPSSDLNFTGGSLSLPGDGVVQSDGKSVVNGVGAAPLSNNDIQQAQDNPQWIWFRIRRTQNVGDSAKDDWEGTAWYGKLGAEPVAIDGSASATVAAPRGLLAMGWGAVKNGSGNEQRIAWLSFTADPLLAATPIPTTPLDTVRTTVLLDTTITTDLELNQTIATRVQLEGTITEDVDV